MVILVFGFLGGLIELSLFAFLGKLVDLARAAETPESFFAQHGTMLIWMGFVALILRPIVFAFHIMAINQAVSANFTNLIRWQTHRYVLRQSIAFFQNDFAGRIANRVMQTGPALRQTMVQLVDAMWFVLIYTTGAMVLFSRGRCPADHPAADLAGALYRLHRLFRAAAERTVDGDVGSAFAAHGPDRRQLHQHPRR